MQESQEIPENQPQPFENAGKHHAHAREETALSPEAAKATFCDYLRTLKYDPRSVLRFAGCLNRFFAFLKKESIHDLRTVTRAHVHTYQAELSTATWTARTTYWHLHAVRRLYDFLDEQGKILMNPAAGIRMPKLERALPRNVLTRAEMRRLLDAPDTSLAQGIRDRAMLEIFYSTGIRLAELCHLTIHDVDIHNGYLRVNCGKGCKDRVVPLGKKARAYVTEYLRHVRGVLTRKNREERTLFVGTRGGFTTTRVNQIVRDYAKQARIRKQVSPHVLRHTCATHLLEGGADISQVQRLLGHVMINTTQIYTRVAQPEVKKTHSKTHPRERDRK